MTITEKVKKSLEEAFFVDLTNVTITTEDELIEALKEETYLVDRNYDLGLEGTDTREGYIESKNLDGVYYTVKNDKLVRVEVF